MLLGIHGEGSGPVGMSQETVSMIRKMRVASSLLGFVLCVANAHSQALSPKWEELTAGDFVKAIHQSQGVCVLPFGILEKHGPHLPIETDLMDVRYAVMN